jgi:ubiquinone/menaquinone biosynthesis C-methylase UbiE
MKVADAEKVAHELWELDVIPWNRYWVPVFRKFAHDLVNHAQLSSGQIILDIGTGTGTAAFEAAKRIKRGFVIGIDRSPRMVNVAQANNRKIKLGNLLFIEMNGNQMLFPDGLFDRVLSNCGISSGTFLQTSTEIFRVLQSGGRLALDDWHLIDVPPHKVFSEILRAYRTSSPSRKLRKWREALATLESVENQYLDLRRELDIVGFRKIRVRTRKYQIVLPKLQTYLKMRFDRVALRQELIELPYNRRIELLKALRKGLSDFVDEGRFTIKWNLNFIQATKR